jgi:hypothetical protein
MADQDRLPDAPRIKFRQQRTSAIPEAAGRLPAGSIPGPVQRYDVERSRQKASYLLPVCARTRLAVQQHDLMPTHTRQA